MSIIPKFLKNLCNCNKIITNIISSSNAAENNFNNCVSLNFQRFLSKRYTIGRGCKPKPKKVDCKSELAKKKSKELKNDTKKQCPECINEDLPKRPAKKREIIDTCTPFRKKPKKKVSSIRKKPPCKPGMKNVCEDNDCIPTCSLTKGKRERSCNECPKDVGSGSVKNCPKGDWRHDD